MNNEKEKKDQDRRKNQFSLKGFMSTLQGKPTEQPKSAEKPKPDK